MILIRGIHGEEYAKKIAIGKVSCRDLLSTVLETHNTGYSFSDYYEKYFMQAVAQMHRAPKKRSFVYDRVQMLLDDIVPYMYITYFHVMNDNSEEWVEENFDDDAHFIYYIPKLDAYSNHLIGSTMYMGQKMSYVDKLSNDIEKQNKLINWGLAFLLNEGGPDNVNINLAIINMLNTLLFPLFHRVETEKFNSYENEFRIIKILPITVLPNMHLTHDPLRIFKIRIDGIPYEGELIPREHGYGLSKDIVLKSRSPLLRKQQSYLYDEVMDGKNFHIDSEFVDIDISDRASKYGYIGKKEDCINFIKKNRSSKYYNYNETLDQILVKPISEDNREGFEWMIFPPKTYIEYTP